MKIFYSWQSDSPRKTNKDFIRTALQSAITQIADDIAVSEAVRDIGPIELDQDTQGIMGSPPVAQVIFEKLRSADVLVADVTAVASGKDGKKHINSNVAIELGFALGTRGYASLLKIMNTSHGGTEALPFDLRDRRHPVTYNLDEQATKAQIESERKKLCEKLSQILKQYAINLSGSPEPAPVAHDETRSTVSPGQYWEKAEPIVPSDGKNLRQDIYEYRSKLIYMRLIPEEKMGELTSKHCLEHLQANRILRTGCATARNKWGAVTYSSTYDNSELIQWIQLFKNREIWFVDTYYPARTNTTEDIDLEYIPTAALVRDYPPMITALLKLARRLDYGNSLKFEIGIVNSPRVFLAISSRHYDQFPGPLHSEHVFTRNRLNLDAPVSDFYNPFVSKLFDEAGRDVPEECLFQQP